ncbi:MAG TPA: hypothetical protein DHV02_05555 [Neisseriales bacterium]|jgi:hypothetical protein|nr:hypothetical protein [Neisseriales bacterium]
MKIQFESQQIRIRISPTELVHLEQYAKISEAFDYLPLCVNLNLTPEQQAGLLQAGVLNLNLSTEDLVQLSAPSSQKTGIKLLANYGVEQVIAVGLQLDLHGKN